MSTGIADIHLNLKYIKISVGDFDYFGNVIVTDQPGSITTQSQRSLSPEYWTLNSRAYHSPHWPIPHWGHSSPGSGGFDGWHHPSAPVKNRGSPEVGQGLLSRLLPCDTITSQDCQESHTGKFHHHRKSHWEQSVDIPACYAPFSDVFCPKQASRLPPHRPWDCAIDLIPGEPVPRGNLSTFTSRTEGHGGIHQGGAGSRLHPSIKFPCCIKLFLCGQKGRRLTALYRLPSS